MIKFQYAGQGGQIGVVEVGSDWGLQSKGVLTMGIDSGGEIGVEIVHV